jgi:hypothetical protein
LARTTIDLFRIGNAQNARMDHVRPKDIEHFPRDGDDWVRAGTGGISTFEAPIISGQWWRLGAGYDYGRLLIVWNDHDQHWLWAPRDDMLLAAYKDELRATHRSFIRI